MFQEYDPAGTALFAVMVLAVTTGAVLWLRAAQDRATTRHVVARTAVALSIAAVAGSLLSAVVSAFASETFCLYTLFAVVSVGGGLAAVYLASGVTRMKPFAYTVVLALGTAEVLLMPRFLV